MMRAIGVSCCVILSFVLSAAAVPGTVHRKAVNAKPVAEENTAQTNREIWDRLFKARTSGPETEPQVWDEWIVVWDNGAKGKAGSLAFAGRLEKAVPGVRAIATVAGKRNRWYAKMKLPQPSGRGSEEVGTLSALPGVLAVSPNFKREWQGTPDDPLFSQQWSLNNSGQTGGVAGADVRAVQAWDLQTGSGETVVAVVDSGVAYDHPDLAANIWRNPGEIPGNGIDDDGNGYVDDVVGYDFGEGDGDPYDRVGHGSHVAGIVGAVGDNGVGISGVSRRVSIMILKIASASGALADFSIIESLQYAGAMGARVINASWGGASYSEALKSAIEDLAAAGVLFVAAAGNNRSNLERLPFYPASYDVGNIVTVAATDDHDELANFSSHSSLLVDLAAPGQAILSTQFLEESLFSEDFQERNPPELPTSLEVLGSPAFWATVRSETRGGVGNIALRPDPRSEPYRGGVSSSLLLPVMALRPGFDYDLEFKFTQQLGSGDRLFIEFYDGVSQELRSQWVLVDQADTGKYVTARIPVPELDSVRIGFLWETDETDNLAFGVELDDIRLLQHPYTLQPEPMGTPSYASFSGTSMAAPHVVGAAALLLAQKPDMSLKELAMRLTGTGERRAQLENRVLLGRRLDLVNALTATGGFRLEPMATDGNWEVSEPVVLVWTFFDRPDCAVDIDLLKDGQVIQSVARQYTGPPPMVWHVPLLEPGGGYRLRLSACDQNAFTEVHELLETQFLTMEDPQFKTFALERLDTDGDGRISAFEAASVDFLECPARNIERLPDLSMFTNLLWLDCSGNNLRELPELAHLPLAGLVCTQNKLTRLPELPSFLTDLICGDNLLRELPDLSGYDFFELDVENNFLTELKGPISAYLLDVSGNRLAQLPEMAPGMSDLICRNNDLQSLPELPDSLSVLFCDFNGLSALPDLPGGLLGLSVSGNRISEPPGSGWPESLLYLDTSDNPFERAPDFSGLSAVHHLFAKDMGLTEVPRLPSGNDRSLIVAHANGNRFDAGDCEDIAEIEALDITDVQIYEGNVYDGWLMNRQEDGSILNCEGAVPTVTDIEGPRLDVTNGDWMLRWRGGGGEFQPIDRYEVIVDGDIVGITGALRYQLADLVPGEEIEAEIRAYDGETPVSASDVRTLTVPGRPPHRKLFKVPEPDSGDWFGLVFANPGIQAIDVELLARDRESRVLARSFLRSLPPGHKRIGLFDGFFPDQAPVAASFLEIRSETALVAVAIFGNAAQIGSTSGYELDTEGALELPNHIHQFGERGTIGIMAPQPSHVTLRAYDASGQELATFETDLEGSAIWRLEDLFPAVPDYEIRRVTGETSEPCAMFQDNHYTPGYPSISQVTGVRTPSLEGVLLTGSRVHGRSRLIHLSVANPNPFRVFVDFDLYSAHGEPDRNVTLRLEPGETRWYAADYLFLSGSTHPMATYTATAPVTMGLRMNRFSSGFLLPTSRYGVERLPVADRFGESFLVPHLPFNAGWWTEIAVQNVGDEDRGVVFRVNDGSGNLLETRQVQLPGKGTLRDFTQNLFETAPFAGTLEIDGGPDAALAVWCFLHPATGEALTGFVIPPIL